ncbi:hypothetical protein [Actinokineospora xionganensis]|uniref:Rv3660c-like CheY-like N-terminal domain-containing protein n=1 Tax=Actinokineospora xionganensis TaxID=2684470 RepID=A0ABR7LFI5_9PSEU|nr:hypothetical protein [Actinokineospora xionganensis]MBC6451353.1 hypothetical protein [Actinokineospora xionganensis]
MKTDSSILTLLITTRSMEFTLYAAFAAPMVTTRTPGEVSWMQWHEARLVLIDTHDADAVISRELPARDRVILISLGQTAHGAWADAVRLHAERVLVLPAAEDYLSRRVASECAPGALTLAVIGPPDEAAHMAAALAMAAAAMGLATALLELRTTTTPIQNRLATCAEHLPIQLGGDIVGFTPGERGQIPTDILARTLARLATSRELIVIDCARADDPASILAINAADEVIRLEPGRTGP